MIEQSSITCPHCRHCEKERMPLDACVHFWPCPGCDAMLRPRPGECCVFCSYGSYPCPPKQQERGTA